MAKSDHVPPPEVASYLAEIVTRLKDCLQDELVGVYLFGSASHGAYEPGLSDLDVQAVTRNPLTASHTQMIVSRLTHTTMPCPATKLEFVVHAQEATCPASRHPRFELNFKSGPHRADHVGLDPTTEASHWVLLDIAIGREHGRCLYGLAIGEAFGPMPRR